MHKRNRKRYDLKPGVAFFMPAHNEADNLPEAVDAACSYFRGAGLPYTIIIVDDGSTDSTPDVLNELREQKGIEVCTHKVNAGYGAALRSGIQTAFGFEQEYIAFCDADNQFKPADIDLLIKAIEDKPDCGAAIGFRKERADNLHRRVTGRIWHWLSSTVLDFNARDVDCGFKLFRYEVIAAIDPSKLMGNHAVISPEILARIKLQGFEITEVAMPHYARQHGSQSGMKLSVMLGSIIGLFKVRRALRKEVPARGNHRLFEVAQEEAVA